MKILSAETKVNLETFTPEMIITMSLPLELVKEGNMEITKMDFVYKEFEKAWKEYQNERR